MAPDQTSPIRVLVVEDAPEFQIMISALLRGDGYEVLVVGDGESAIEQVHDYSPDVVVLDLGLPDIDGLVVCERLREHTDAYVLMLTGRTGTEHRVDGLSAGADDYLAKPFEASELLLRIEVLLRRPRASLSLTSSLGDVVIDRKSHQVTVAGRLVALTKIELAMLEALVGEPGAARSRNELARAVWGPHWVGDDHVINVHVANLRKKIDADAGGRIATVRGIGYRFDTQQAA